MAPIAHPEVIQQDDGTQAKTSENEVPVICHLIRLVETSDGIDDGPTKHKTARWTQAVVQEQLFELDVGGRARRHQTAAHERFTRDHLTGKLTAV
jgi:hypothetical protein